MAHEAQAPVPSLPRIGEQIAGKYRIDRILATGGMGVVVAAKHIELNQRVAIKFLLPEMLDREELIERFLREAKAMVGLHGEHAVRVFDVGTLDTGSPYMVMELLRGNDLDEELEVRGPLDVQEAIHYFLQACEAIAEAHRVGIVHRDIKPSNLFLARRPDGSRIIKVLDFGISKLLADEAQKEHDNKLTTTTAMLGSPQYMSPEQVRSARDVDGRSDIWSLGCVLYEMLANVPPFAAQSVSAVSAMIVADDPPALGLLRGDLPPDLDAVLVRCLAKKREERYQTVASLAEALAPFAAPRSRNAIERVVRISMAPRYESSFPPPFGASPDDVPTQTARRHVDGSASTISEVTVLDGAHAFRESEATLSATSTASRSGERSQQRRNGLLVALAALLGAGSVWALLSYDADGQAASGSAAVPSSQAEPAAVEPTKGTPRDEAKNPADAPQESPTKAEPTGVGAEPEPELDSKPEPRDNAELAAARKKSLPKKQVAKKPPASRQKLPSQPVNNVSAAPTSRSLLPQDDPLGSRH